MSENFMIIKTKKLSPREVKKKLRDFIDEISDGCGPEIDEMADELKAHGDAFIDALSGNGNQRNSGGYYRNDGGGMNGGYQRNGGSNMNGGYQRNNGRGWHRDENLEHKLQEMEREMQELRQQVMS